MGKERFSRFRGVCCFGRCTFRGRSRGCCRRGGDERPRPCHLHLSGRGRYLLGGLPSAERMCDGFALCPRRSRRKGRRPGGGLCKGGGEGRRRFGRYREVPWERPSLGQSSSREGFFQGKKEGPRVPDRRCGLRDPWRKPLACRQLLAVASRSTTLRLRGKADGPGMEETMGRNKQAQRDKKRGDAEGSSVKGARRRSHLSFEKKAEWRRGEDQASRNSRRGSPKGEMGRNSTPFRRRTARGTADSEEPEPKETVEFKRKGQKRRRPRHGVRLGESCGKKTEGGARPPQVKEPAKEVPQPEKKRKKSQQAQKEGLAREEIIEISDEEFFIRDASPPATQGQQGPRFSLQIAAEECSGGIGRSSCAGRERWQPIVGPEPAIGLLPDHLQADFARKDPGRARAGDNRPLSRSPCLWEAGGARGHPSRPVHSSGVGSDHRKLERRPTSGGGPSEADRTGTPRGASQSPTTQQAGRESSRPTQLEAISNSRSRSPQRWRSPQRRREGRKRESRRPRKRQRRWKKECLEVSSRTPQGCSKGRRSNPEVTELKRNLSTCAGGAVDAYLAGDTRPGRDTGMGVSAHLNSAAPQVNGPLQEVSEEGSPCGLFSQQAESRCAGLERRTVRQSSTEDLAAFCKPQDLGLLLAKGIPHGCVPTGLEFLTKVKHYASQDAFLKSRGIFPLPVDWSLVSPSVESSRAPRVQAWLPLVCHALNSLSGCKKAAPKLRTGKQVQNVLRALESRIERFLSLFEGAADISPVEVWEDIKKKKISYEGEEVAEPVALTKTQIMKSVPPEGHGGSVELTPLLEGHTKFLLENPEEILLGAEDRMPGPNRARVHIVKGEELAVWSLLHERGVTRWIRLSEVHADAQGPFLSGLFGVPKPGKVSADGSPVLRVIMNLKPINRAMRIIQGDIAQLPSPVVWTQIHLGEGETIDVSQADMSSAFYLFRLPSAWHKFLAFDAKFDGKDLGLAAGVTYVPACQVLPMGWSSSVGIMQMVSRELIRRKDLGGADELRRQALVPRWFVDTALRSGPRAFWQVYLDNFMGAELRNQSSQGRWSEQLHSKAVEAWDEAKVLCAADKHVIGSQEAVELGVQLHSQQGLVGGDAARFQKLLGATMMLLRQKLPKVKWVQVVLGRWIFVLQYRRSAMAVLSRSWNYTKAGEDRRRWWPVVQEELGTLVCLAPLIHADLRTTFLPEVSCSDASHFGGAVAVSRGATCAGNEVAQRMQDVTMEPIDAPLLVISAFNGIGGAFRGYDLAGVKPAGLIAIEWDKGAQRVNRKAWPQTREYGDIQKITWKTVQEWANLYPRVVQVHLIGGFPCVHLSSARANRRNLEGQGSRLFWDLKQLLAWIEQAFGHFAQVEFLIENVLSMDVSARQEISKQLGVEPVAVCPSGCLPYNRPRLAWCSHELVPTESVSFEQAGDHVKIHMTAESLLDCQWLEVGWRRLSKEPYPTFMKAIPRYQPPPAPAGIHRCGPDSLARWESDSFRFPPYQYLQQHLVANAEGDLRYLKASEREVLLGFGWGHTITAMPANKAKDDPQALEDKRLSLCGDSFSMLSFGWIIAQLCSRWVPPASPQHLLHRFGLAPGAGLAPHLKAPLEQRLRYATLPETLPDQSLVLAAHLSRHVNHTGADVSLAMGIPFSVKTPNHASVRAGWWQWQLLFRTRWKHVTHINYLEMKMIAQAVRWRARYANSINKRWVHLADSMVCNYILAKGRTSSVLLQPVTREIAAHLLALNSTQLYAHVDSHENPTDEASRS